MDWIQIAHISVTAFSVVGTLILGYLKFSTKKDDKQFDKDEAVMKDVQQLTIKFAILEERVSNQIEIIKDISHKIDRMCKDE